MNNNRYKIMLPLVAALCLIIGLWAGRAMEKSGNSGNALAKLDEVMRILNRNYVDEVDMDSLIEQTIPELIRNLDPHSNYISVADRAAVDRELESSFFGIGVQFQILNDTLMVFEVTSGGPAEEAGVQGGDRIVEVDGNNIAGMGITNEDVFRLLRGPEGTEVSIGVLRKNSPSILHYDLIRRRIDSSPIDATYMINDTTAYIRLGKFSDNTFTEFLMAYASRLADGANSFIIDLRGNGGGYMMPAVLLANEFMGHQQRSIVSTKGRTTADNRDIFSDCTGAFANESLVFLIDEFTASASEILAGAVQDNDRGLIVGRRSFGKGLVQTPFELSDSSELRLTVQRYYTPSGRCIQKPYSPGDRNTYESEVYNRFSNGEIFSIDSIRIDSTQIFHTAAGRPVFGGGGIMPDIFVPTDTSLITNYYIKVSNEGLIRDFAYEYADLNRETLSETETAAELMEKLPEDYTLLQSFVRFAQNRGGVAPRWYYINTSAPLIVNQIKALIARDIQGLSSYYEIVNLRDPVVLEALRQLEAGNAVAPVTVGAPTD